jgi:hypothetical protein
MNHLSRAKLPVLLRENGWRIEDMCGYAAEISDI